jgi:hypothetical protein
LYDTSLSNRNGDNGVIFLAPWVFCNNKLVCFVEKTPLLLLFCYIIREVVPKAVQVVPGRPVGRQRRIVRIPGQHPQQLLHARLREMHRRDHDHGGGDQQRRPRRARGRDDAQVSRMDERQTALSPGTVRDNLGKFGYPKNVGRLRTTYCVGDWSVFWGIRYSGSVNSEAGDDGPTATYRGETVYRALEADPAWNQDFSVTCNMQEGRHLPALLFCGIRYLP